MDSADAASRQAQRLQTIGILAGGVAHEVNNMMTVILGFADLALRELGPEHPQHRDVAEIAKAAVRTAHVTRQLLAFSREEEGAGPRLLEIGDLVDDLVPTLRQVVGAGRRLIARRPDAPITVAGDRGRLEQVVINLVANARDATATDGLIAIEVEPADLDDATLRECGRREVPAGGFVRLVVRDNGVGIPDEVLARVFEPFFTTKAIGTGTGLGLPMVCGIVQQSGGFVQIDSVPGRGTEVAVYLPIAEGEADTGGAVPVERRGHGETVLVVEDDPILRSLTRRILETKGYGVIDAANGAAALDLLDARGGGVALVLTDVVMPRMTGPELAAQVRERYPDLPVLFMSGYAGEEVMQRDVAMDAAPWVQKPFTTDALAEAVADALERSGRVA